MVRLEAVFLAAVITLVFSTASSAEEPSQQSESKSTASKVVEEKHPSEHIDRNEPAQPTPDIVPTLLGPKLHDPMAYYNRGCELLKANRLQDALNHFNKALELNPKMYEASYKKALIYQLTGYDKFAARRYQEILKYRPDMDLARINLATLHHKHKHYKGAEEQLKLVINRNYYNFEAHYNLANVYLDQQKPEDAVKEYKLCLKLQPKNGHVHNNMGVIFLQKKYVDEAVQEFRKAAALEPANKTFSTNLVMAQKILNKKKSGDVTM